MQAVVLQVDQQRGRLTLSTKKLEATPGEMLRDPHSVYVNAEERAQTWRESFIKVLMPEDV